MNTSPEPPRGEGPSRAPQRQIRVALTVAGLDPSGGAGLLADVRTFWSLGLFSCAVLSTVTFQNTMGMSGRSDIPAGDVARQLEVILDDRLPDAVKTGALGSVENTLRVARILSERYAGPLVVDPVLRSGDGRPLLGGGAGVYGEALFPLAALVTPNVEEASRICGFEIFDHADMEAAALRLVKMGAGAALVTGGRLERDGEVLAVDVFCDGRRSELLCYPWIETGRVHGTGCVLSAAITASLALGWEPYDAVSRARRIVRDAMLDAVTTGGGVPSAAVPQPGQAAREE